MRERIAVMALVGIALFVAFRLTVRYRSGTREGFSPSYDGGRLSEGDGIRVLRLAGTPRAKGRAHGRLLKGAISERIQRLRPLEKGVADFAIETCGNKISARLPPALREELEGIAEGAGVDYLDLLFLNTRYELGAYLGGDDDSLFFAGKAGVGPGPEVFREFGPELARHMLVVIHEDFEPCLVLVTTPGVVGGFMGLQGPASAALRPIGSDTGPVLTGLSWPLLLRLLVERPPTPGGSLPAPAARAASVPMTRPDGFVGTLNLSPAGATWYRGFEGMALASDAPVTGLQGKVALARTDDGQRMIAGERARRFLTSEPASGLLSVRLKGGRKGVQITFYRDGAEQRRVVRYRE